MIGSNRERWKKIFHNYYEVSDLGRVRRIVSGSYNTYPGRILNPSKKSRYPLVVLYGPNKIKKTVRVHILVARAFLGPCPEGKEVNHKDTNRWNPALSNLEYATPKQNGHHALINGLNLGAKLSIQKVKQLRKMAVRMGWEKGRRGILPILKGKFNIQRDQVVRIILGRSWDGV